MASNFFIEEKNKGFTLMETIVALGIGMITIAMIVSIFTAGLKNIREVKDIQTLNSSAIFFLDRVTYLVKQGKIFDASTSLDILLPDGSHKLIGTSTLQSYDTNNTTTLTFTKMIKNSKITSVRINFITQRGSEILSATTTIAQRAF